MLITGQVGTTTALLLIGLVSLILPEGSARGFVILSLTVTFLVGFGFPQLLAAIGLSNTCFVFAVLGLGAIAFVAKYIPETNDKSLEDLEHYFKNAAGSKPPLRVQPPDLFFHSRGKAPLNLSKELLRARRSAGSGRAGDRASRSGAVRLVGEAFRQGPLSNPSWG